MAFLANNRILITRMLSNRSVAYGIAQTMHREGEELAFTYQGGRVLGRVEDMASPEATVRYLAMQPGRQGMRVNVFLPGRSRHWLPPVLPISTNYPATTRSTPHSNAQRYHR